MKYITVVEIPKGSDRRIHMAYDNSGFIDLGPIKDQISVNEGVMPVAYGYLLNYINANEKDNVDSLIFSENEFKTGDEVEVEVFGMLTREDGDHKVLVKDSTVNFKNFDELSDKKLLIDYFGFKSKVISVGDESDTKEYLNSCLVT